MPKKRGELSEALKYILVAFAGIALLTFFILFARNITETGTILSSTELRETLNDYFTALSTADYIQAPGDLNLDVTLLVNQPSCQQMSIAQENGNAAPAQTTHIIYSPPTLTGKSLEIWSNAWYYPYRVTNFFYLTNIRTKTILVGNDQLINQLLQDIPSSMNVEKGTSTTIQDYQDLAENYDLVHVIVIGNAQASKQDNIILTSITPQTDTCTKKPDGVQRHTCTGTITYHDGQTTFYGMAMLYGALFTTSNQDYSCALTTATTKLQHVSTIYSQKQQLLKQRLPECASKYILDFSYTEQRNGWAQKAHTLADQNRKLGGTCDYVF